MSFNGQLHSLHLLLPVPPLRRSLLEHLSLPSCLGRLLPALLCVHLHSAQPLRFRFSRRTNSASQEKRNENSFDSTGSAKPLA